jgi:hypothetical protein
VSACHPAVSHATTINSTPGPLQPVAFRFFFRSSLSVAKYCAKKLPAECAVLAVSNGKIVFRRESSARSGKVSAEVASCADDEMCCVVPFQVRQGREGTLSVDDDPTKHGQGGDDSTPDVGGTQSGKLEDTTRDVGAQGNKPEDTITEEQPIPNVDPVELPSDQVRIDKDPSCKAEGPTAEPKVETAELPGGGASILYCVLPDRSCDSVASTSSRQDRGSVDLPAEGDGELYCVLPPRNHRSGRSVGDSMGSTSSRKDGKPANRSPEGDTDLYCQLPRKGRPGRSSGRSNRSFGIKGLVRRSSSFSNDVHLNSETSSPIKKNGSFSLAATEETSSTLSTDSSKGTTQDAETPLDSPMSLRRLIDGRPDRCHLPRRIFSHHRSSSFDWAKMPMVQWAMRLPSRYTSVHPDSKPLKSDATPRLNCDSETESTSMFSFAVYDVVWPPSELESLGEKYSSVCRLFSHEELKLATANYSPGNLFVFHISVTLV